MSYSRERNLIIFIHEKVDKEAMCMLVVISLLALAGAYGVLYLTAYVPVSFLGQYDYKFLSVPSCYDCKSKVCNLETVSHRQNKYGHTVRVQNEMIIDINVLAKMILSV